MPRLTAIPQGSAQALRTPDQPTTSTNSISNCSGGGFDAGDYSVNRDDCASEITITSPGGFSNEEIVEIAPRRQPDVGEATIMEAPEITKRLPKLIFCGGVKKKAT